MYKSTRILTTYCNLVLEGACTTGLRCACAGGTAASERLGLDGMRVILTHQLLRRFALRCGSCEIVLLPLVLCRVLRLGLDRRVGPLPPPPGVRVSIAPHLRNQPCRRQRQKEAGRTWRCAVQAHCLFATALALEPLCLLPR